MPPEDGVVVAFELGEVSDLIGDSLELLGASLGGRAQSAREWFASESEESG